MSLTGDLKENFMKTSSNGFRLSPIPMGIEGSNIVATTLDMGKRLDQFLTTEILFGKDYESLRTMGRIAKTGAAISIQVQEEGNKKYAETVDRILFNNLLQKLDTQIADYGQERETLETILIAENGEDFIVNNAERYLDAETLKRKDGESEKEYRERLADELADLMLLPDGTIDPRFEGETIARWLFVREAERNLKARRGDLIETYGKDIENGTLTPEKKENMIQDFKDAGFSASYKTTSSLGGSFSQYALGQVATESDQALELNEANDLFAEMGIPKN